MAAAPRPVGDAQWQLPVFAHSRTAPPPLLLASVSTPGPRFVLEPPAWLQRLQQPHQAPPPPPSSFTPSSGIAVPLGADASSSPTSSSSAATSCNCSGNSAGPQQQPLAAVASTTQGLAFPSATSDWNLSTTTAGRGGGCSNGSYSSGAAAVQQCLNSMRGAGAGTASDGGAATPHVVPLWALLNAVLPLLGHVASVQSHMVQQLRSRFGGAHRRGGQQGGQGGRPKEEWPEGTSSALMTHGPRPASRQAQKLFEQARALEKARDPLVAAEAFTAAVQADPRQAEWITLAAKQWSDAMYAPNTSPEQARRYNRKAIEVVEQAMAMDPNAAHSYICRCVSRGRLALLSDNRTKVQLASEAQGDAQRALELEPNNDYAHHLMGRWHYEMAGLNAIARTLVRLLFGASLMQGSLPQALEHYRRATLLAPRTLIHRVEYSRCLHKLGRPLEAISELQEAFKYEPDDLNGHLTRVDCEQLLEQLLSSPTGRAVALGTLSLPPPLGFGDAAGGAKDAAVAGPGKDAAGK